jgi:hypothetical protein
MDRALTRYGEQLLDLYPRRLRPDLTDALAELALDAVRLGAEVVEAETCGLGFSDAARDHERFPLMAKVHFGLHDLLQVELAPGQAAMTSALLDETAGADLDGLRRSWFLLAGEHDGAAGGALMRFLLYQAVRLNAWVLTWQNGAPLEAAGALRRFDDEIETDVRARLAMVEMRDPDVRPLHVLVVEALERLAGIWQAEHDALRTGEPETYARFEGLIEAATVARDLGAGDAALVRNEIDGAVGGKRLGSHALAQRCPTLRSQNATDQRRRRLLARLAAGPRPQPSGRRLIDLIERRVPAPRREPIIPS